MTARQAIKPIFVVRRQALAPVEGLADQHVVRVGAIVGSERIGVFIKQFREFAGGFVGRGALPGQLRQFTVGADQITEAQLVLVAQLTQAAQCARRQLQKRPIELVKDQDQAMLWRAAYQRYGFE